MRKLFDTKFYRSCIIYTRFYTIYFFVLMNLQKDSELEQRHTKGVHISSFLSIFMCPLARISPGLIW